jgi:RNA polymerase sigma-70 factor (ECF subfamily)
MRLRKEIASLPSDLREVIILRDLQGFSYEEIAKIVGCPLGTIKSRLFYARQILREKLSPLLGDEKDEL